MRKVKTYKQFVNEENIFGDAARKVALGTALVGSTLFGSPQATGQEIDRGEITGKAGVDAIEDERGEEVKDISWFEDLVYRVQEVAENSGKPLLKKFQVVKVEHLKEWQQYKVYLKELNVAPNQNALREVYIPQDMFEQFQDTGYPSEHIINTFVVLENPNDPSYKPEFFQAAKRKKNKNTYYIPNKM